MVEKLKSVCFRCKVNKWVVDFKEGSLADISSTSVCLFCEQAALIEAQKKEIKILKIRERENDERIRRLEEYVSRIEKFIPKEGGGKQAESEEASLEECSKSVDVKKVDDKIEELKKVVIENRDEIVETGKQVVEIREEIASFKDNGNFRLVKGKKSTVVKDKEQGIALANRYAALEDEAESSEVEAYVIGDSIVREQTYHFAMKSKKRRRKVQSYSGCKAKKVIDEVKALKVQNKDTCIIANVGSNDLYLRENKVGNTEPLVDDLKSLVDSIVEKTNRGILVGLMPRVYASYFAMSKAIGINERLRNYCNQKRVDFIDVWKIFISKRQYFRRDGIHLNETGHKKLGEILCEEFERVKNKVDPPPKTPEPSPTQPQETSTVNNGFEGFPKGNH